MNDFLGYVLCALTESWKEEVVAAALEGGRPLKVVESCMQKGGGWSVKQVIC